MTQQRKVRLTLSIIVLAALLLAVAMPFALKTSAADAAPVLADTSATNTYYSGNYYNNLNTNLTGTAFRTELYNLISNPHKNSTYDGLKTVYKTSDADPNRNGNILWFYTGTSTSYNGSMGSSAGTTNREHVWPKRGGKAFTPEKSEAGSDAHHLRPTDATLNSTRGEKDFDEVPQTSSNIVSEAGKKNYGSSPDGLCYSTSTSFYPAKGYRGATARILFYVQVRWGDKNSLRFVDTVGTSGKTLGKISTLLKWHLEEPPTEEEIRRNEVVFGLQNNRNPFIDHPEYAEMIYCYDGQTYNNALKAVVESHGGGYMSGTPVVPPTPDETPTQLTLSASSLSLKVGETSQPITVSALPQGASNSVVWGTSDNSVATVNNGAVTAVGAGTATITAVSVLDENVKASLTVTVTQAEAPPVVIEKLEIFPSSLSMTQGGTRQLSVQVTPERASTAVTWSSTQPDVATVSASGLVTAVKEGETVITATSVADPNVSASVKVKVVSQAVNTETFRSAMASYGVAQTLEDKYNALQRAIEAYGNMDEASKATVTAEHEQMIEAVEKFNGSVGIYNNEIYNAAQFASQTTALSISAVLLAIVAIVGKALGR